MSHSLFPFVLWSLLLAGAACQHPGKAPPTQPQRAPTPSVRRAQVEFVPQQGALELQLVCKTAESALANGLDDDCDGRVDGTATQAALTIALAAPSGTVESLCLAPLADASDRAHCLAAATPSAQPAFDVVRLDPPTPAPGEYRILVNHNQLAPVAAKAASLSVVTDGVAHQYSVQLESGAEVEVGRLRVL